jgi:EAL domain-containing protein (putative c-di-GMP-specific phosphodiesterase class I)/DNA-binding NarL/FixJ family response regulator
MNTTTSVLVVEDQPDLVRALVELIASRKSLRLVGSAENVERGLELASQHRPDVALVDVKMPGGGGPRFTHEVQFCSPETRVVALSAYEDRANVFDMLRAGAVAYLVKGTAAGSEILTTVEQAARGLSTLSGSVASDIVHELAQHLQERRAVEHAQEALVARLRETIDSSSVKAVYQPIVELESRRTVGYEALARIVASPIQGPEAWLADAASVGLGLELERAALKAAFAGLAQLPPECFLSVNLSPAAILDDQVRGLLETAEPTRTVVEITEHRSIDDYGLIARALQTLRTHGLRLAVDDAGAGYASLRHLLEIRPDLIKLDASLTRGIDVEPDRRALAQALIAFARATRVALVAEGIETAAEEAELKTLGVVLGQGYHLGKPGPLPRGESDGADVLLTAP